MAINNYLFLYEILKVHIFPDCFPVKLEAGSHLLSHTVSSAVPSAAYVLTFVFGMGTGVSHKRITTGKIFNLQFRRNAQSPLRSASSRLMAYAICSILKMLRAASKLASPLFRISRIS